MGSVSGWALASSTRFSYPLVVTTTAAMFALRSSLVTYLGLPRVQSIGFAEQISS